MNITEANLHPYKSPDWKLIYDFNSFYEVANPYDYQKIKYAIEMIMIDEDHYHKFLNIFLAGGLEVEKYHHSELLRKNLYCKQIYDNLFDLLYCSGYKYCKS